MSHGALPLFPAKSNLSLSPLQLRPKLSMTKVARNESVKRQQPVTQSPTQSASKHFAMLSRGLPNLLERARAVTANIDATEAAAEERPMWQEKISLDQEDIEHPLARISTARREAAAARKQLGEFLENLDLSMVKLAGASEALVAHNVREGLVELDKRMWEMRYVGADTVLNAS